MTFLLYAAGAMLCAAGTRAAAIVFGAAAVTAVLQPGTGTPVIAWTAVIAAGLIVAGMRPRRLALAAIGAAGAIAAGSAGNAAVVLALWTLGTGAAVLSRPPGDDGRRWAFAVLEADVLVAAAVVYTALSYGFAAWPERLGTVGATALLASALARVPAMGWPGGAPELGLVLVRAQAVVLVTIAVRAAGDDMLAAIVPAGAVVFAAATLADRAAVRDAFQEIALVGCALAVTGLGWRPAGWVWGALAGGTLMHYLRLSGAAGGGRAAPIARALSVSGGVGLPLLPAATAVVVATLPHGGYTQVVVITAIGAGLAGRAWARRTPDSQPELEGLAGWRWIAVAAAAVVGLAAPALALPRPPGGERLLWPPVWAAALVITAAAVGAALPWLAPAAEAEPARRRVSVPPLRSSVRLLDPPVGGSLLAGLLTVFALVAAGVLVLGWLRGFL